MCISETEIIYFLNVVQVQLIFVYIVADWKPRLHEHQNVLSVRAGTRRNRYKKETNQLV